VSEAAPGRIMTMRFRPANIRVINRRASSPLLWALLFQSEGPRNVFLAGRPVGRILLTRTVLGGKGRLRRFAPLSAARRSGYGIIATSGPTQEHFVAGVSENEDRLPSCGGKPA
jgi:hypothetical protein